MRKIDEINSYLNINSHKEKEELLKNIMKIFNISNKTAELYYYKWKKDFMNTKTCISENKEDKKVKIMSKLKIKKLEIEGEFGNYIKEGNKVVAGEVIFNSLEDIEEYEKKEIELFNKKIQEIREVYKIGQ
ncbi:hypothetical protein H9660_03620 [Clostridium sp. Sa3CUN1]|uniref:Uncharacterized protein n=1 Tax=Clostridium gallinarum TaxID=2762246 RepID=A0ABR8Q1E5_9CLOT|nr:hypothetical protein [Clostridium gallinarum]MBD7914227.1 hypothetical protein [Clostridium gallinarum]